MKPILFTTEMVRAILEGRKAQSRRIVKPQPKVAYPGTARIVFDRHPMSPSAFKGTPAEGVVGGEDRMGWLAEDWCGNVVGAEEVGWLRCPYGYAGDQLWVRESWQLVREEGMEVPSIEHPPEVTTWWEPWDREKLGKVPKEAQPEGWMLAFRASDGEDQLAELPWRPNIHMPRWACRLFLDLEAVSIERLQDITTEDILAEGIRYPVHPEGGGRATPLIELGSKYAPVQYLPKHAELKALSPEELHAVLLRAHWASTWNKINAERHGGAFAWEKNPWVWKLAFKRAEGERDAENDEAVQPSADRITGCYPRGASGA